MLDCTLGFGPVRRAAIGLALTLTAAGQAHAAATDARFESPAAVAVDGPGSVYVADLTASTVRRIAPSGAVTTLAGMADSPGSADGTGAAARFANPGGVAVDGAGVVYIADSGNNNIRRISPAGAVTTLAGSADPVTGNGFQDGTGLAARFSGPAGLAIDTAGNLYVADFGNNAVRKITPAAVVTTLAGSLGGPSGVAVDAAGNVYVACQGDHTIRRVSPAGAVTLLAGAAGQAGSSDGTGAAAHFNAPQGVAVDGAGNILVADTGGPTVRRITPAGVVSTLAGAAGRFQSADGLGAAAGFEAPVALAVSGAGVVYLADYAAFTIRRLAVSGAVAQVTTLAGAAGQPGTADAPAPAVPALAGWQLLLAGGVAVLFLRSVSRRAQAPA